MSPGPLPDPNSRRSRRRGKSTPAGPGFVDLVADPNREVPALPRRSPAWTKATRSWWKALWCSPMGQMFDDMDRFPLARLAALREQVAAQERPQAALLTEIRNLESAFGLSPVARARLRWRIVEPDDRGGTVDLTLAARRVERRRAAQEVD